MTTRQIQRGKMVFYILDDMGGGTKSITESDPLLKHGIPYR